MASGLKYQALEPGHIRLLRLLRASSPILSCELVTTRLRSKKCPEFMALSYSWEDQAAYRPILVDGQLVRITPNAEAFLRQAQWANSPRSSTNATKGKSGFLEMTDLYWLDAICINQSSNVERASQVQMMKQIYETADYIAIWLGEPSKNTSYAFEYLKKSHREPTELSLVEKERSIQGLMEILGRPYWSRSWVLQEATTPKEVDCIKVLCGDLEAPLDWLFELSSGKLFTKADKDAKGTRGSALQARGTEINPYIYGISKELSRMSNIDFVSIMAQLSKKVKTVDAGRLAATRKDVEGLLGDWESKYGPALPRTAHRFGIDLNGLLGNIFHADLQPKVSQLCPPDDTSHLDKIAISLWRERIAPLRSLSTQRRKSRGIDFYSLPRLIRLQEASDPRDKLFAPLQLTTQAQRYAPSYDKPTWVVYCEFAASMIESDELLDILSFGHKSVLSETVLPSWVPDWTRKYNFSPLMLPKDEFSEDLSDIEESIRESKQDIDADILESLRGQISGYSTDITPADYLQLRPTKRPRLIVCGIKIGRLEAKSGFSRFSDLSEYFEGRVSFTFSKEKESETDRKKRKTTIFGVEDAEEDEVTILAPSSAMIGDEVYYVFGARYPLILRREATRPFERLSRGIESLMSSSSKSRNAAKKSDNEHPDGLKEFCFCGEAVCRTWSTVEEDDDDEDYGDEWKAREHVLSLFSWGQTPRHYQRILRRRFENEYRGILLSDQIEEMAIV